jgi:hypothetical protein
MPNGHASAALPQAMYCCPVAPCRKKIYRTRAVAKRAIRAIYPGQHLSVYRACPGEGFHIGRLNVSVVSGAFTRRF